MRGNHGTTVRALLLALLVLVCAGPRAGAADDKDKEDKPSPDLKKLQGVWTTPSAGGEGEVVYTFKDKKVTVKAPTRSYQMTVTLDESAKPHKKVDLKIDDGPDDAKGQTSVGIYKFEGDDKFVFCFRPGGERPEKFEQVGFEQFLVELKRKDSGRDSK